jgi:integrase
MRRAYNLGLDENLVSRNPCLRIKMLKEKNVRDRVLTFGELERLCKELSPVAERVVVTAYQTGMRQGEIVGLTVSKVNLEEGYIDLDEDDTKDHERRRVYFGQELRGILQECFEERERLGVAHEYVFVRKNGKAVRSVRTAFENACRRAGLNGFRFHDLRHTYNTDMRKAGVHDSVIMKQTGHATLEMFLRYNTVDEVDGKDAVRRREAYLKTRDPSAPYVLPKGNLLTSVPKNPIN